MQHDLGFSAAQLTGAFSLALLVSAARRHRGRPPSRPPQPARAHDRRLGRRRRCSSLAWSQVDGLAAFYALWVGIGLVMAAVLYEPAFTVLAKHFPDRAERRRAMTAMTLVAALASFIFLPLSRR